MPEVNAASESSQWKHTTPDKNCPGCGDILIQNGRYFFCEREHGTRSPSWAGNDLPVAIRSATPGRFILDGMEGYWKLVSHCDRDSPHGGPPSDTFIAAVKRINYLRPTIVALRRVRQSRHKQRKANDNRYDGECHAEIVRPIGFSGRILLHKKRVEAAIHGVESARATCKNHRPYGFFIKAILDKQSIGIVDASITEPVHGRCLAGSCNRSVFKRGLCRACYSAAKNIVHRYPISWIDIDLLGLASPAILSSGRYFGIFQRAMEINRTLGKPKATPPLICVIDGCGQRAKWRGLCKSCYQTAADNIRGQRATWTEFESLGLALQPTYGRTAPLAPLSDASLVCQ